MSLIVFDLEWNQCPMGKDHEMEEFPFEIIEIGAVKLNEKKEIVDTFDVLIRPVAYKRLHFMTREVIHLTMNDLMRDGVPFAEAAASFLRWCGENPTFCTWGGMDLYELQRNMHWHNVTPLADGPVFFEDVQKLFAIHFENRAKRRALSFAVDYLQIPEERGFHMAIDDAWYTAAVLARIPDEVIAANYSVDTYHNPQSHEEELRIRYETYEKFISRPFETSEEAMEDGNVTAVRCFLCRHNVRRVIRWFANGGKSYLAVGRCPEHGFVKSKVRIRKAPDGKKYAVKTTKMISAEDAEKIRMRQYKLRIKRRQKRKV
jgi:inhibitor of KinA sporulation pathway (predicted exonuclease)